MPQSEPINAIYIHIPFCRRKCFYCDFAITTGGEELKEKYIKALCQEIELTQITSSESYPLHTVFFGGGTPSLLTPEQITKILDTINRSWPIAADAEISLEANPGTVSLESLKGYKQAGINRLSLGAQAFQLELLDMCGRGHGVAEIYEAVTAIKDAGITNWSLDLISGLPHQTLAQWQESLQQAIALAPTHISVYDLAIEAGTAFGKKYEPGAKPLPTEELTVAMYLTARDRLLAAGYDHYEISNYAQSGYQCRHNRTYWQNQSFWGMGMGATSYVHGCRCDRPRKMRDYLQMVDDWQNLGIVPTVPQITAAEDLFDTLMQGLRLAEGLSLDQLVAKFGQYRIQQVLNCLQPYIDKAWVKITNSHTGTHITLTQPTGWLFSNEVIADLFALNL